MAQHTRITTAPAAVAAPPSGRSPRVGKVKSTAWDYTRWRMTINDPDSFMEFMRGYPSTEGLTIFLYRLVPRLDLSIIGHKESNIQKGSFADLDLFSVDAVAEKFQRGKYNIRVTDSNRPEGQREVVKACQYKVTDGGPPVYDLRTLEIGHADNIDEVNRLISSGVLVRDASGAPRMRTANDPQPSNGNQAAPVAAANPLGSLDLGQVVAGLLTRAATDPGTHLKEVIEIARTLHPPQPVFDMDMLADRVAAKLGRTADAAPVDMFAAWDKLDRFAQRARGSEAVAVVGEVLQGSGASPVASVAAGGSWVAHLPGILSEAKSLIPELVGAFREFRGQPNGQVPQQQQERRPMTWEERVEDVLKLGFRKMGEGVNGFDYAAWLVQQGPAAVEVFAALDKMGAAGLMGMLAMSPKTAPIVQSNRPQLEKFLDEFFSYSLDPVEEDGPPAAGGVAAGGAAA